MIRHARIPIKEKESLKFERNSSYFIFSLSHFLLTFNLQAACFDLARQLLIWLDLVNPPEGEVVDPSEPLPGNPATGALPQPPLLTTLAPSDPRATAALKTCEDVATALRALSGHGGGKSSTLVM